jgi:hypothetical protein
MIKCDRQVADANARRMIDGVGDGGGSADDPDFAHPFRTHRIDMRVNLIDPGHVDGADIGVGRDVVLREVVVHVVAEARVQDARLVQRHRQAHRHRTQELRAGRLRVDDATGGKDPQQPWDAHLTGVRIDADLDELRAKGVHGELLRLGVRVECAACLQPPGRDATAVLPMQPCAERARRIEDRPPPRGGPRRTPGHERPRQGAITDLKLHALQRHLERVCRDLGQHRPGSGPDVRGVDANTIVSRTIDLRERGRWKLDGRKRRGGNAGPDEPGAVASRAWPRVARLPAEALRSLPQACHQVAATERVPGLGIDRRFVADAQFDRIKPTCHRQLIHRRLEREHPRTLARGTHDRRHGHVEPREPVRGAAVRACVHHPRCNGGLLDELVNGRGLLDDVMRDRREPTITIGPKTDALDRRRAIADQREHLLPRERELDGPPRCLRSHHGEDHVRMREPLGAEAAADIARDDAHALGRESECRGHGIPDGV